MRENTASALILAAGHTYDGIEEIELDGVFFDARRLEARRAHLENVIARAEAARDDLKALLSEVFNDEDQMAELARHASRFGFDTADIPLVHRLLKVDFVRVISKSAPVIA